jgi:hypothetical protein
MIWTQLLCFQGLLQMKKNAEHFNETLKYVDAKDDKIKILNYICE